MDLYYRLQRNRGSVPTGKREPQAGVASGLSNTASRRTINAGGDAVEVAVPNIAAAVKGKAVESPPGSKSVANAEADTRNWGDPDGSRRPNYESQAGRGIQRQGECSEARQGVGFAHSSQQPDDRLEAGEGADRLMKLAQATRCRKTDGTTLANLPAGDTQRISLKSPVRENRTPGSVRGAPGNRCPYLDASRISLITACAAGHIPSSRSRKTRSGENERRAT